MRHGPCFSDIIAESIYYGLKGEFFEYSHCRFEKYGFTFASRHITSDSLHTNDPQNIKEIFAVSFKDYHLSRYRVMAMNRLFGGGIFTKKGTELKDCRALIRPCFSRRNIEKMMPILEFYFEILLQRMPTKNVVVDFQSLFLVYTLDTSTEFFFGTFA